MKTYFHLKDNVLDKKLAIVINSQTFTNHKQVSHKAGDIVKFYAEHFTKNNLKAAEE